MLVGLLRAIHRGGNTQRPDFEKFTQDLGRAIQNLLTDPAFFDHADERLNELREKASQLEKESDFKADLDRFLRQLKATVYSVRLIRPPIPSWSWIASTYSYRF